MIKIADLLDRDFSIPIEELVKVKNDDPETAFTELTEYIATDRLRAEYEGLFSLLAAARKSPDEGFGVWISGFFGSGKSSFAKNLGSVLANRELLGASARSLFLKRVESRRIAEHVEFLNRTVPCEIFILDGQADLPAQANAEQIAEAMYRTVLRDLDHVEADLPESQLSRTLTVKDWLEKLFAVCEIRRPGKTFAFLMDEMGEYAALGGGRREHLHIIAEHFRSVSLERLKTGKLPGPAWIVVIAEEKLDEALQEFFKHRIDLSTAGIGEIAARRVLRKKESQKSILRKLFRDYGSALLQNVKLERCSRRTDFDEDQFVQFYPYLPHFVDLSIDIVAGIRLHPNAPKHLLGGSRTIVKQCSDLLMSDQTRFADQPIGALVSIDKIYELLEMSIPQHKHRNIIVISEHGDHKHYPGMAERVAKAICLMEFARNDLPRTTKNIAALLIENVNEAPPTAAVTAIVDRMREACLVRETAEGWKLHEFDFDELHRETDAPGRTQESRGYH